MSIYDKPVRLLMKEYVKSNNITKGVIIQRDQVFAWFKNHYPKIKSGTISAHLLRMSINAPSRVHYSVSRTGDDDLFFQIDSSHFRLYDTGIDPLPIYLRTDVVAGNPPILPDPEGETESEEMTGFAYESDLRDFLSINLNLIEKGLVLYEDEGIKGIEFPVGGRFIDILAIDRNGDFVVIELKVSRGYDRTVGQLLRYMAWIEKNLANPSQKVRGAIIARVITDDLQLATSKVNDVLLFEYDLSVVLRRIS